jgi:hypothetical protein
MRHFFGFSHGAPSNDDHKLALERATAELTGPQMGELRQQARELELPFESLLSFYHSQLSAIAHERRAAEMRSASSELEIRSLELEIRALGNDRRPVAIKPGEIYEVVVRPQYVAFKPERLEIKNAELWTIKSFRIGNREQLKNGDIHGASFNELIRQGHEGPFECAQTAMDVALLVQLSRHAQEPIVFEGKFYGRAAV